ncbi:uncharacterized protein LOC101158268 isoform X2 [Oryzias latipes]|uniref:uncharacterized protein LOC101158268 isoform X2 n=1 Tax=Oryzias latipes TaxID=8090 RepID=UPI000CE1E727|nr:uncharacterized protein LOC101158268 isoform X2 [Oryzias latipes]
MMKPQLLFTLMYFFLVLEANDLSPAKLTVDVAVITETDSVTLKCQIPSSASGCTFFTPSETFFVGSCLLRLTGAELLNLTKRRSPATIEVRCFYTEKRGAFNLTSVDSDPSIIEINNLLPPDLSVNSQAITETDSVTLNCQPPVSVTKCNWHFKGKKRAEQFSCSKTLTGAELLRMASQSVPAKVQVWCTYLNGHQSPKSQRMTITVQFPPPELRVNPAVITERDSATLACVTPSSLSVTECHFYYVRSKTTRSSSCMQTLTAAELLFLSGQSSPAEVQLMCFYPVERDTNSLSPHSNVSSIHIKKTLTTTQRTSTHRTSSVISTTIKEIILTSAPVSSARPTGRSILTSLTSVNHQPAVTEETHATTTLLWTSNVISATQIKKTQQESESNWKRMLYTFVIGPGFGVTVGVVLLGVTLLCSKRRRKKYATKRSKVYSTADIMDTRNSHSEDQETAKFTAGPYHEITTLGMNNIFPAVNCPAEFEWKTDQQSQNESSDVYHVYASIAEEDSAPALRDVMYHKLQSH